MVERFDVIVIGGGTAGLVTASGCARLGRRVALIDRAALGGDCLWTGCVPSKALIATAKLIHQMRHAGDWGIDPYDPKYSARSIMNSMREARRAIAPHDDPARFRALGIDVIEGDARLVSISEVDVAGRRLAARDIVIATGSRTAVPPIDGLEETGYLDHKTFLDTNEFPQSIAIIGGGAIGIEYAQVFRRFGVDVTVIESLDRILSKEDDDVIDAIRETLIGEGIAIRTGCRVIAVRNDGARRTLRLEKSNREIEEIRVDAIFVASGRRGNIEGLGLESAGVKVDRSFVVVNKYLETSVPRIWAAGDIHGGLQFTHVAGYEAVKIVRNMLFPGRSAVEYTHVPWAIYTDPEVARVGITESEAVQTHGAENVRTYRIDMHSVDRAIVDRTIRGFVKFVCDRKGAILGAHVVSSHASTVITTIVAARKKGAKIGELAQLVSAYPSLTDAIGKAAALHYQSLGDSWLGKVARRVAAWTQ